MSRAMLALGGIVGAIVLASPCSLGAAELLAPAQAAQAYPNCGPCGCMSVTYVHHRDMQSTYGLGFDPRNYDTTEPTFISVGCMLIRGTSSMAFPFLAAAEAFVPCNYRVVQNFPGANIILNS